MDSFLFSFLIIMFSVHRSGRNIGTNYRHNNTMTQDFQISMYITFETIL